jgi:hypothetical protein
MLNPPRLGLNGRSFPRLLSACYRIFAVPRLRRIGKGAESSRNRITPAGLPAVMQFVVVGILSLIIGQAPAGELQRFDPVRLIPTDWADGDSFEVEFPNGERHTIRLYGADCFEWHVADKTDARRLSAQRRYFGITNYRDSVPESVALAKSLGAEGAAAVRELLADPFVVHTSFADGGGDGRYKRIYGFITSLKTAPTIASTACSECRGSGRSALQTCGSG